MKKLMITGNVGNDPEMSTNSEGREYAKFSVGVKANSKATTKTDWVQVTCNGNLAEFVCTYVKKGTKLLIEGKTNVSAYIDKKTNKPVGVQNLYADTIEILSKKSSEDDQDMQVSTDVNEENFE